MATTSLLSLFAQQEPTTDDIAHKYMTEEQRRPLQDVVLYRDRECTNPVARFPWHLSNRPRRHHKQVMVNCHCWELVWI